MFLLGKQAGGRAPGRAGGTPLPVGLSPGMSLPPWSGCTAVAWASGAGPGVSSCVHRGHVLLAQVLGHMWCPVASPPGWAVPGPFSMELLLKLEQMGCARSRNEVSEILWERGQDAWDALGAGTMCLGGSRSRDATRRPLPWWAEGEGWLCGQLPAADRAAPGIQVSAPTAASLVYRLSF